MVLNILKLTAVIVFVMVMLVACADKGYIAVPQVNTNLEKIHSTAIACGKSPEFTTVTLRKIQVDRVEVEGKTTVTLSATALQNLVYNLEIIDKAGVQRNTYTNYLRECLSDISILSVENDNSSD